MGVSVESVSTMHERNGRDHRLAMALLTKSRCVPCVPLPAMPQHVCMSPNVVCVVCWFRDVQVCIATSMECQQAKECARSQHGYCY